jgi:SAM-dependent methyltransferase
MSKDNPFSHGLCEVCDSPYKILLRHVGTMRTKRRIPLFYCMDCESMTCIDDYIENTEQLIADVEYNVNLIDMKVEHFARTAAFLRETLYRDANEPISHADVGCNIGVLVKVFGDAGFRSTGYDINPFAIDKAKTLFPNIEIVAKRAGSDGRSFDLVTLIDVLEHIKEPSGFFRSILPCMKSGGHLFIIVPRVDRSAWKWLSEDSAVQMEPRADIAPFMDNDVHVVHYSSKGLAKVGQRFGLEVVADFGDKPWPQNGILFRKPLPPVPTVILEPIPALVREKRKPVIDFIRRSLMSAKSDRRGGR